MFTYNCEVTYIVDGDTCDVKIDLVFNIFHTARVRLYGINAPESRTRRSLDLANLSEKRTYDLSAMIKANTEESLEKYSLNEEKNG